jgi:D-alanyl-D-alanine dipeptidase
VKHTLTTVCLPLLWLCAGCAGPGTAAGGPPPAPDRSEILRRAAHFDLVEAREVAPDILVDLRYATKRNPSGRAVYPSNMPCLVRRSTAEKLRLAQERLRAKGYGLLIWDAWRPPEAQLFFMDHSTSPDLFMDPRKDWSGHCAGAAVDVTLVDSRGRPVAMPSDHDEDGPHTGYHYKGSDRRVQANLWALQSTMHQCGFSLIASEWWHFDDATFVGHPTPIVFGHQLGIRLRDKR